jgi:hypothetical protein
MLKLFGRIKDGLSPRRTPSFCVKGQREIPLTELMFQLEELKRKRLTYLYLLL